MKKSLKIRSFSDKIQVKPLESTQSSLGISLSFLIGKKTQWAYLHLTSAAILKKKKLIKLKIKISYNKPL